MSVAAFRIESTDNVATLLDEVQPGSAVQVHGAGAELVVEAGEMIRAGHKIALTHLAAGDLVCKYGLVIGAVSEPVEIGGWVHLHNCRSRYDDASSRLSADTGARSETRYE